MKVKVLVENAQQLVYRTLGMIVAVLSALFLLISFTIDDDPDIVYAIVILFVFLGVGLYFWQLGRKKRRTLKMFKKYVQILSTMEKRDLTQFAKILNIEESELHANLELLIKQKYFPYAHIDYDKNLLVVSKKVDDLDPTVQTTTVKCKSCGATSKMEVGKADQCGYCGSKI